jgi:hydrogenase-4 component B
MTGLIAAALLWIGGAAIAGLLSRRPAAAERVARATTVIGAAALAVASASALRGVVTTAQGFSGLAFGPLALRLDPLAAVFLAPIALIGGLGAIYAPAYARLGRGAAPRPGERIVFELLLASMALVVVSANTVLLLVAWELMTLLSWLLVTSEHEEREVRRAGLGYLIAGQFSGGAIALLCVGLAQSGGGWLLPWALGSVNGTGFAAPAVMLVLAVIGFGTKAAVVPFHVWLPDAHAAAPSHVSALMSGVLVTLGFYGIVRVVPTLAPMPVGWPIGFMGLGALGAAGGIVMALGQRDVKRVLAYSTVENAGLITLAIGAALLAGAWGQPLVAALAWSAALLHVWNHAVAKGLLFLSAGAIARQVGSRDLERWGGLLRRLRWPAVTTLVGAAALVGLPGTHGFASEWLLLLALFRGGHAFAGPDRLVPLLAVVVVAFASGTAVACFVRLVGIGLLGHPRSPEASRAEAPRDPGLTAPLVVLAGACLALVPALPAMLALIARAVAQLVPGAPLPAVARMAAPLPWLATVPLGLALAALGHRAWLARTRPVRSGPTWDCGYARPEHSMQYSASSLSQPITGVLEPVLRTTLLWHPPRALWPSAMSFEARTPERAIAELYRPGFRHVADLLGLFTRLQKGRVMVYLRYVGLALLLLLAWLFWPIEVPR